MNDLNSLLIEGSVVGPVVDDTSEHGVACNFRIVSHRHAKGDNDENPMVDIPTTVQVFVAHGSLANRCIEELSDGRKVRIVGRVQGHAGDLAMIAEHIEFRLQ